MSKTNKRNNIIKISAIATLILCITIFGIYSYVHQQEKEKNLYVFNSQNKQVVTTAPPSNSDNLNINPDLKLKKFRQVENERDLKFSKDYPDKENTCYFIPETYTPQKDRLTFNNTNLIIDKTSSNSYNCQYYSKQLNNGIIIGINYFDNISDADKAKSIFVSTYNFNKINSLPKNDLNKYTQLNNNLIHIYESAFNYKSADFYIDNKRISISAKGINLEQFENLVGSIHSNITI